MMIANSRRGYNQGKQEGEAISIEKLSKAASNSRQWSGLRNPRIVRVSRSFGGKDRHSKVCTIRGLRDRRIRLSVPTAIQLYDLQDRLGLSQPSKVIDWLIEATKHDIDKLPPLQIPQGFAQTLLPHHDQPSLGAFYDANSTMFIDAVSSRIKGKEDERAGGSFMEKGKWIKTNEQETEDGINYAQNLFPIASTSTHSFLPGLLNNTVTYNNNNPYHWEPSNLSLFGSHGLFPSSQVDPHSVQFPSLPGSQLFFCPASATPSFLAPYNAPYMATSSVESDPRSQFNHIQFLSSTSQVLPHHPPSLHDSINSSTPKPLPTPFSSRLLDSEHKNTTRS